MCAAQAVREVRSIAGSFIGGTLANLIFHDRLELGTAGFIGSVLGAILLLLILGRTRGRRAL